MAHDKRLPYPAETADTKHRLPGVLDPDSGSAFGCLLYTSTPSGAIEWRHEWLPHEASYTYDAVNGNSLTIPMRIRATDYFKAVPGILGWAVIGGDSGSLKRRLPIRDPDGQGMVATRIVGTKFEGESQLKPGPLTLVAGSPSASQPPRLPVTPGAPDLFKDDCYSAPDVFNFDSLKGGGYLDALKQVVYVKIMIEFRHPFAPLQDDTTVGSDGNTFGKWSERLRNMWGQFDPTIEVIMSKTLTLKFGAGAVDQNNNNIAGQACATEAPFLRPSGTLLVHWERVPVEGVAVLFSKFEFYEGLAFDRPLYGTVNQAPFKIGLYNTIKTYAANTLLFLGCRPEPRYYAHGKICYDLTYAFGYRGWQGDDLNRGWNHMLTGRTEKPQPVVRQDGTKVYTESDFEQLFRCD